MHYCPECGAPVAGGAKFCTECGLQLGQASATEVGGGHPAAAGIEEVVCGYCGGTGRSRLYKTSRCPVCTGTGQVRVYTQPQVCSQCHGTGHSPYTAHYRCPGCSGTGWANPVTK